MTADEVHAYWAPPDDRWSPWVKPVLFAYIHIAEDVVPAGLPRANEDLQRLLVDPLARDGIARSDQTPYRAESPLRDTAIVVDLAGERSALVGASLARHGVRPVPLYNAIPSPRGVIDLAPILQRLVDIATAMPKLPTDAPPAFLLDADRATGGKRVHGGVFDNRSVCNDGDFPSVETLVTVGVRRAVLIQAGDSSPASDLTPTLYAWQHAGIQLWRFDPDPPERSGTLLCFVRPSLFRRVGAWFARFGLQRTSSGAYGKLIPTAQAG